MHSLAPLRLAPAPSPPTSPISAPCTPPSSPPHLAPPPACPPSAAGVSAVVSSCSTPSSNPLATTPSVPNDPSVHLPVSTSSSSLSKSTRRRTRRKPRPHKPRIPGESRYWTPSEHRLFVQALLKYGPKDLKSIAAYVGTRNMIQCRTHEQKYFLRLMRTALRDASLKSTSSSTSMTTTSSSSTSTTTTTTTSTTTNLNNSTVHKDHANATRNATRLPHNGKRIANNALPQQPSDNRADKVVYSLPSSCGLSLLCAVGEEMRNALEQ